MFQSLFARFLLVIAVSAISFLIWRKNKMNLNVPKMYIVVLLLFTFLLRLFNLNNVEGNVDTSVWLSSIISIRHYPDKLWTLLNFTHARPLTVLPLFLATELGMNVNYISAQIVTILLWVISLYYFYFTIRLFESRGYALLFTWAISIVLGCTGFKDYISYNSEDISILMLTVASYWYLKSEKKKVIGYIETLALGLLLGSLHFAKFQNVPMGLIIGGFGLYSFIVQKDWKRFTLLCVSSVLPTLLIISYYALRGQSYLFWDNYFWNYFYYSYTNEFSSTPMAERFNPIRIGRMVFRNQYHGLYFISLAGALLVAAYYFIRNRPAISSFQKTNGAFAISLLLASLYAIAQSGNPFYHYILYLFIPFTYLVAWLVSLVKSSLSTIIMSLILVGATLQGVYLLFTRHPIPDPSTEPIDKKVIAYIQQNSGPNDRIIVWGWADRLYVRTNRPAGYRYHHTMHLFLKSALLPSRIKVFGKDLIENKPLLFVDAVNHATPSYSMMEKRMDSHESIKEISGYIKSHYRLVRDIEGVRIYKRIKP